MKRLAFSLIVLLLFITNADAASRFWVGGTGSWDASDTTHWAASSGGAGGQTVPGSGDTVTLDGSSGGGTVTLNFGGTIALQSITMGAFTGTFDNSVNNNNMTLSASTGFNGSGNGVRTYKLGTAIYTLTANNANWNIGTFTNLTYSGNTGSFIVFTGSTGQRNFIGSSVANPHGSVTFGASSGAGIYNVSGTPTMQALTITAPNYVEFNVGSTTTIATAFTWTGSSSNQIGIFSDNHGVTATIAAAASSTASWSAFRDMTFTGSPTAANSFDNGINNGIAITAPGAGGGSCILGGWLLWRDMPEHINDNFPAWLEKAG